MNQLAKVFDYKNKMVRTETKDNQIWFCAKDVCEILEIKNHKDSVSRLRDYMQGVVTTDTLGGKQEMIYITEPGLYKLIFSSRKKEAELFTDWLATEVIPQIRQTGSYLSNDDRKRIEMLEKHVATLINKPVYSKPELTTKKKNLTFYFDKETYSLYEYNHKLVIEFISNNPDKVKYLSDSRVAVLHTDLHQIIGSGFNHRFNAWLKINNKIPENFKHCIWRNGTTVKAKIFYV